MTAWYDGALTDDVADALVELLLDGEDIDAVPATFEPLTSVLAATRVAATDAELAGEWAALASFRLARTTAGSVTCRDRPRRTRRAKALLAAGIVAVGTLTGAAAATGRLPDIAQDMASTVLGAIGIDVASARDGADRDDSRDPSDLGGDEQRRGRFVTRGESSDPLRSSPADDRAAPTVVDARGSSSAAIGRGVERAGLEDAPPLAASDSIPTTLSDPPPEETAGASTAVGPAVPDQPPPASVAPVPVPVPVPAPAEAHGLPADVEPSSREPVGGGAPPAGAGPWADVGPPRDLGAPAAGPPPGAAPSDAGTPPGAGPPPPIGGPPAGAAPPDIDPPVDAGAPAGGGPLTDGAAPRDAGPSAGAAPPRGAGPPADSGAPPQDGAGSGPAVPRP